MPERKYLSHSSEECTGMCNNRTIKDAMGGSEVIRDDTLKHYKKSGKNGRKS